MDANEDIDNPKSKIMCLFAEMDLIDLHYHCYSATPKPATHQHESCPIDMIAGSNLLAMAQMHAWILPFAEPPLIKGDHRLLGLDFHPGILFGSAPNNPKTGLIYGLNSHNKQNVNKIFKQAIAQCNTHNLANHINALLMKAHLTETDLEELEQVDSKLTKILVRADQSCHPTNSAPWCPTLQTAYLHHQYWTLKCAMACTQHKLSSALMKLAN